MSARTTLRGLALTAAAAGSLALGPAPAAAATTSPSPTPGPLQQQTLATIQQRAAEAIADRQATLRTLTSRVQSARELTGPDRAALLTLFQDDSGGLAALGRRIAADTSARTAWQDAQHIVTDYRIYVLVVPQTHLVIAADTLTAAAAGLQGLEPQLQTQIARADLSADQRARAEDALADLRTQVSNARATVAPLSARVLALTPAGYPGNRTELEAALDSVGHARAELGAARHDVDVIEDLLGHR